MPVAAVAMAMILRMSPSSGIRGAYVDAWTAGVN